MARARERESRLKMAFLYQNGLEMDQIRLKMDYNGLK